MKPKKMIFLDRDGVINVNPVRKDYIRKPSKFKFIPGVPKAVRLLTEAGFDIVVISNQAGLARGLFSRDDLKRIDEKMMKGIKAAGGRIRKSYYCIHHPESNCKCRKPKTGLIEKAVRNRKLDHKNAYFVGDTERDVKTGKRFRIKTIAVLSGYASRKDVRGWKIKPDFVATDLLTAVRKIILKKKNNLSL